MHFERFEDLIGAWVPLTVALNSLNRSMGLADVYPFVLAERVVAKLNFVHEVVERAGNGMSKGIAPDVKRAAANRALDATELANPPVNPA